ncbi:MAG: hypothetical protein NTV89_07720 [Proteobacteria bacterium]|nr:hypothetical protein [Pseudomonadota bacterium]
MNLIEILRIIGDIVSLLLLLCALIGFAMKHFIKEKIGAYFKTKINQQNEFYKHNLKQEIEAYKAALIRDLEEYKLGIDIRRNIAFEVSNQKMKAYQAICSGFGEIIKDMYVYSILEPEYQEDKLTYQNKMNERLRSVNDSLRVYDFFIDPVKVGLPLSEIYRNAIHVICDHPDNKEKTLALIDQYGNFTAIIKADLFEN